MKINEIFYSIQGEGYHSGTAAVFVRFAGCNLKCDFCDTLHQNGVEMSEEEIAEVIKQYPTDFVVLTGGEPSLQLTSSFLEKLHKIGKYIAIETNGTNLLPDGLDWITCSPKYKPVVIPNCDELKVVYEGQDMTLLEKIRAIHRFLQPCDRKDAQYNAENLKSVIEFCLEHPQWRISLQTQKILDIR